MTSLKIQDYDDYLGKIYDTLLEAAVYLDYFKQLFCGNHNRIDIINDSAPTFFELCRMSFIESVIMRIAKVTDNPNSGGNSNLTLLTLLDHFFPSDDTEHEIVQEKLDQLRSHLKSVREKRNKHLGHLDINAFQREFPITLEDLSQAIEMTESIFNLIVRRVPEGLQRFQPNTQYFITGMITDYRGDARAALIMLERGRRFKKLIKELPDEYIKSLVPDNQLVKGRGFFQHDILHYIDRRDNELDR